MFCRPHRRSPQVCPQSDSDFQETGKIVSNRLPLRRSPGHNHLVQSLTAYCRAGGVQSFGQCQPHVSKIVGIFDVYATWSAAGIIDNARCILPALFKVTSPGPSSDGCHCLRVLAARREWGKLLLPFSDVPGLQGGLTLFLQGV